MIDKNIPLVQLMHMFHRMYKSCIRFEIEQQGLPDPGNIGIMFALWHSAEHGVAELTQKEIADFLGIAAPTVAVSIKRMEKAGLICKRASDQDQRKNYIAFTDYGRKLTRRYLELEQQLDQKLIAGIPKEDIENMRNSHLRMLENMLKLGARPPNHCKGEKKGNV